MADLFLICIQTRLRWHYLGYFLILSYVQNSSRAKMAEDMIVVTMTTKLITFMWRIGPSALLVLLNDIHVQYFLHWGS